MSPVPNSSLQVLVLVILQPSSDLLTLFCRFARFTSTLLQFVCDQICCPSHNSQVTPNDNSIFPPNMLRGRRNTSTPPVYSVLRQRSTSTGNANLLRHHLATIATHLQPHDVHTYPASYFKVCHKNICQSIMHDHWRDDTSNFHVLRCAKKHAEDSKNSWQKL